MIECNPQTFFSWSFTAYGLSTGTASIKYQWLSEQGSIITAHRQYDIVKHGIMSGRWTQEESGQVIAVAQKPSPFSRSFNLRHASLELTLQAATAFTRNFEILLKGEVIGHIQPAHMFTRRATVVCPLTIPEDLQLFLFWLVGLSWKRSSESND
ncbi:hypothetical protein P3T73_12060 [Kiritimatiellota bacterium B12222]|nr:hypothetical protein P3T73_12060 [Kiritimatiellota bacterium B12222]